MPIDYLHVSIASVKMLDLNRNEEEILKYWLDTGIMGEVRAKNRGKRPFYFLDGPPFVSGDLHPGQIWVKAVKDATLRYKRYKGYDVHDKAGYDVHGLPIENRVERLLKVTSKKEIESKVGVERFVAECMAFVKSYMGHMDADYNRFGISLDFSNPYLPFKSEYIETGWSMLKKIDEKGLLYKGKKSMPYCTHCGTAVAQGGVEIEYHNSTDPSIYIAFRINLELSKQKLREKADANTYLLVWTTTPWTIPANLAIAANPKELYVKARFSDKKLILMKSRLDAVSKTLGESAIIEDEFYGSELDGLYYTHPLEAKIRVQKEFRKYHKVLFDEVMVSSEEGTGLVHIAPGHGPDDFSLGLKNKLPIFSPIDEAGLYTSEVDSYAGLKAPDEANKKLLDDLQETGALLGSSLITHSYPFCWRCESKIIFIATKQWFINIQKVKKRILSQSKKVVWHPAEASEWEADVLSKSPDWTISRQRYWGAPIPIWECSSCNSYAVIGSRAELAAVSSNPEEVEKLDDLHKPHIDKIIIKCKKCGAEAKRIPDVFDVWFDSSIAYRASLTEEEFERLFPMDYVLEGRDQIRAWFSYQLKMGVIVNGRRPFDNVGVDGMLLAEDGRQMHKHLGNYVSLADLLKFASADSYRLWCTEHTPWLDLQYNANAIRDAEKALQLLYNISNMLKEYSDAIGYLPNRVKKPKITEKTDPENIWLISRLNSTIKEASDAFESYEVYKAAAKTKSFMVNDLSRFYLKGAKKKVLYSDKKTAKATLDLLSYSLYNLLVIMSPIIPFTAEKIYLEHYGRNAKSIFLNGWPNYEPRLINKDVESEFAIVANAITAILFSREKAGLKLRQPLSKATIEVTDTNAYNTLLKLAYIVTDYTNLKKLDVKQVKSFNMDVRPAFSRIGPDFKDRARSVAEALTGVDANVMLKEIDQNGYYRLHTQTGAVDIKAEHFTVIKKIQNADAAPFDKGIAYVDREMSKELREEAVVREFERGVQLARKSMRLKKADKIILYYQCPPDSADIMRVNREKISKSINAKKMVESIEGQDNIIDIDLEGEIVRIAIGRP